MKVTDFIDSVLIIDNSEEEVQELKKVLLAEDISVDFRLIDDVNNNFSSMRELKKNRQIIFMDLSLDDSLVPSERNISERIRPLLQKIVPKGYGCYGMVVWSKHTDLIDSLKERLLKDKDLYSLPIFIVSFDKGKYMANNYNNIFEDLNEALTKDKIAYFFLNWMSTVKKAANNAISDIYSLVPEYDKQQTELLYLMYKMALNHTGIPEEYLQSYDYDLTTDAYKAFDELLYSDLINQLSKDAYGNMFVQKNKPQEWNDMEKWKNVVSTLNSKMFIDTTNLDQNVIIPGNVYKVINAISIEKQPEGTINIAIELTPPCDFSQKKKIRSRIVHGFLNNIDNMGKFKREYHYKDMFPIEFDGTSNLQMLLDFRYFESIEDDDLKNPNKYELIFRVNPKLFADILQKFSSSYARLGLSKIE